MKQVRISNLLLVVFCVALTWACSAGGKPATAPSVPYEEEEEPEFDEHDDEAARWWRPRARESAREQVDNAPPFIATRPPLWGFHAAFYVTERDDREVNRATDLRLALARVGGQH